jgi:hypothetical protein
MYFKQTMAVQFTLSRMFQLIAVVAILCSLFATMPWPVAFIVLCIMNAIACAGFWIEDDRPRTAWLAFLTSAGIMTAFYLACLQLPIVPWIFLIAACILQLATILSWFFSDSLYWRQKE